MTVSVAPGQHRFGLDGCLRAGRVMVSWPASGVQRILLCGQHQTGSRMTQDSSRRAPGRGSGAHFAVIAAPAPGAAALPLPRHAPQQCRREQARRPSTPPQPHPLVHRPAQSLAQDESGRVRRCVWPVAWHASSGASAHGTQHSDRCRSLQSARSRHAFPSTQEPHRNDTTTCSIPTRCRQSIVGTKSWLSACGTELPAV